MSPLNSHLQGLKGHLYFGSLLSETSYEGIFGVLGTQVKLLFPLLNLPWFSGYSENPLFAWVLTLQVSVLFFKSR